MRPLGVELLCRGLRPLCEGLEHGGSSVEEGVEQPAEMPSGLYLVLMEWMVTITGDRVGYPRFSEENKFWRTSFICLQLLDFKSDSSQQPPIKVH